MTSSFGPESSEDVGAGEERTEDSGAEGEPGVRRRRRSLLATLEQIGRRDEEEEGEEEFQLPQREDDGVFTLNKCILGAVILLGLGTIFFSGTRCWQTCLFVFSLHVMVELAPVQS